MNNPFDVIEARLGNIETLLLDLKHRTKEQHIPSDQDRWMDLPELCNYHPDKPSNLTVYRWVNAGLIPVHKGAKKLFFILFG